MGSEYRILKRRDIRDTRPLEDLEDYVPKDGDVRFRCDVNFYDEDETAHFVEKWQPEGFVNVFHVIAAWRDYTGLLYFDDSFEVARFDNLAGAVHFKLWLD